MSSYIFSGLKKVGSFISSFNNSKKATMIILGLENTGKTTLLKLLTQGKIGCHEPTIYTNKDVFYIGDIIFDIYDLGSNGTLRSLWENFYVDCIVFIIDVSDHSMLNTSVNELSKIIVSLDKVPILVLGNKSDIRGSYTENELKEILLISNNDNIKVCMCSIVKKIGIKEGFEWIYSKISNKLI